MQKTQSLKVKKTLLELENNFVELKDKELKDRELKIRKKMEKLFLKPIIVSIDDIKRFEQKKLKKERVIKNTWYDWSISYILEPVRKNVGCFKDKVANFFKTNIPEEYGKQTVYGSGNRPSKPKIQKQPEYDIINSIRNFFN